ncbi:RtcB family protein [Candidatus Sumerlaeota bacterium]|nr:RtcB family protein [Candidatus Sumerlaeota bacterium]
MKARELINLGVPHGPLIKTALECIRAAAEFGMKKAAIRKTVHDLIDRPESYHNDALFAPFAQALTEARSDPSAHFMPREAPAPHRIWGEGLDENALQQLRNACSLPVSERAALMPDAHVGYGLPIGGVLAVRGAVIPYAVGVDIACRMKLTVLDIPPATLDEDKGRQRLTKALETETRFGIGASFKGAERREHTVMDEDWKISPVTRDLKDKAWSQLGTSGSGNHFVEYGVLTLEQPDLGLAAGTYLALLSHSGSRGTGAEVCSYYSKLAMQLHADLPKELRHLAWLELKSEAGQEYWRAMNLMGRYAAANHALIHQRIARHLGVDVLLDVENHHNFAWEEQHDGERLIVHRKGATPAGKGALGVIPGSMADPGFIVRGKGGEGSLDSASHGAGRQMSRKQAMNSFTWNELKKRLKQRNVTLLTAGLDEAPMAYKNIEAVMSQQSDLVEIIARFDPRLVKMAPAGERPED